MEIEPIIENAGTLEPQILAEAEWHARAAAHQVALAPFIEAHLERRHRGEKHPVHDFLFEYFNFRPSNVLRWSPGINHYLEGAAAASFLERRFFSEGALGVGLYPASFPEKRIGATQWISDLLKATQSRPPFLGCMGLHEWAMVFEPEDVRHPQIPLRMPHNELVAFVSRQPINCTHFDAFRFFSKGARPLNRLQPTADTRGEMEQPGCLHANMDLYKWVYKMVPWTSGELLRDAFLLAVETREIDMRASPYDLSSLGYEAIAIETPEGRNAYTAHQQVIYRKGKVLRQRLIDELERILKLVK